MPESTGGELKLPGTTGAVEVEVDGKPTEAVVEKDVEPMEALVEEPMVATLVVAVKEKLMVALEAAVVVEAKEKLMVALVVEPMEATVVVVAKDMVPVVVMEDRTPLPVTGIDDFEPILQWLRLEQPQRRRL